MSESIQSLRHRIDGAGDLEGVVRAMKALAASSIGQYEKAVESLKEYYRTVELGLSVCLRETGSAGWARSGVAAGRNAKKNQPIGVIVFGSDQGLVGQFNDVIADLVLTKSKTFSGQVKKRWAVGERVQALLSDAVPGPVDLLLVPTSVEGITPLVGRILVEIESAREKGELEEVYVFHNYPKSGSLYEPNCKQLLPLDIAWQTRLAAMPWPSKITPEVIGAPALALESFISGYLFVLLFQACAESLNSENASRLAAMQRAEKNIGEILKDLNQKFHRARQASIDEELFDVISGFEALTASGK